MSSFMSIFYLTTSQNGANFIHTRTPPKDKVFNSKREVIFLIYIIYPQFLG